MPSPPPLDGMLPSYVAFRKIFKVEIFNHDKEKNMPRGNHSGENKNLLWLDILRMYSFWCVCVREGAHVNY